MCAKYFSNYTKVALAKKKEDKPIGEECTSWLLSCSRVLCARRANDLKCLIYCNVLYTLHLLPHAAALDTPQIYFSNSTKGIGLYSYSFICADEESVYYYKRSYSMSVIPLLFESCFYTNNNGEYKYSYQLRLCDKKLSFQVKTNKIGSHLGIWQFQSPKSIDKVNGNLLLLISIV